MDRNTLPKKEISPKSTKKQLWEAYQAVLDGVTEKQKITQQAEMADASSYSEEEAILKKTDVLNIEKAIGDIGNLKISLAEALNNLEDQIVEELKKLELVNKAIAFKDENLKNLYKIEAEAINLFDLIEAKEKEGQVLQSDFEIEKEKLEQEILLIKKQREREEEEYRYQTKVTRQQEEEENNFKNKIKERDFNEKFIAKQKELSLREQKLAEQEEEIKKMKARFEQLPEELLKTKDEAFLDGQNEAVKQAKIEKELSTKDSTREQDIANLKIVSLEEIVKRQVGQIQSLETKFSLASQKAQELAVKIIESRKEDKNTDKPTVATSIKQ